MKKRCFCSLVMLFCAFICFPTVAEINFADQFSAVAVSYDFVDNFNWGFNSNPLIDYWPSENVVRWIDTDYEHMEQEAEISLVQYPEDWRKGWIRIEITPERGTAYTEDMEEITGVNMAEDPMYMSDIYINHVEVSQINRFYWKPRMVYSGSVENNKNCKDIWYLEFVMYVEGMSDIEIEQKIENATIVFDVDAFFPSYICLNEYSVSTENMKRERCFDETKLAFRLTGYEPYQLIYSIGEKRDIPYCSIPVQDLNNMKKFPEDYVAYKLEIEAHNNMPWAVYTLFGRIENGCHQAWLVYNRTDDKFLGYNDLRPNSSSMVKDFILIIHKSELKNKGVDEVLFELNIQFEFSTEIAGHLDFGTNEKNAFSGPRFSLLLQHK